MPSANIMLLPVNLVTLVVISIYHLIPIRATSKKEASAKAKKTGVVKRDHPDWCLKGPTEITKEEYNELKAKLVNDPYWNKKTRQNTALLLISSLMNLIIRIGAALKQIQFPLNNQQPLK